MARDAVRCALIGIGMMGSEHAAILAASPAADLVIGCDLDAAAADRLPAGTPFTTNMEEALDAPDLDAVIIATPPEHHATAVAAAASRGLAVFCEKPIAASLADADAIVALSGRAPGSAPVVIGHVMRFDPRYRALHAAIAEGRLGHLAQLSFLSDAPAWQGRLLAGRVSLAIEMAIHGLDLVAWLAGDIERVYAELGCTGAAGEGLPDALSVTLRFTSGAVGSLDTNWALATGTGLRQNHQFTALGSKGVAWVDGRDSGAGILSVGGTPEYPGTWGFADAAGDPQGVVRLEVEQFLRLVRGAGAWPVDVGEARAALAAALAVDRSVAEGRPVTLAELG
jgi:myo-inositol 2-dehydrogenase/D-chiro-inositol 1-dehydrogenase